MLKNISQPTDTIINEIIDYFETTDNTYFCITWGSGCVLFKKRMIGDETGFNIGYTDDWLGRFKKYSDTFTRKNLPVKMFNFIGVREILLIIGHGPQVNELQTSNFCQGIRRSMHIEHGKKWLAKHFRFNVEEDNNEHE
jgi:hypothetical protein